MKKNINFFITVLIFSSILSTIFLGWINRKQARQNTCIKFGVLQTISHPALDKAREGLEEELGRTFGKDVELIVQNAQGSMLTAQNIAKSFHCNKGICGIVTIGTLATQAVISVEKTKPIFFCAVTDPIGLGLFNNANNICGVSDSVNIKTAVKIMKQLVPSIKTVSIIFNPAEANSVSLVKKMDAVLNENEIKTVHTGVNSESEVLAAASIAMRKADALLVPTDNTVACVMQTLGKIAAGAKKPLFICDSLLVTEGVLAAAGGVDYKECGFLTAQLIEKVFCKKEKPSDLRTIVPECNRIIVHKKTAEKLNLQIPKLLQNQITWKV
jgi:putative tryptophan/tyrosine transport system substrate-binding protein